jgi:hypothetical protein
VDRDGLCVVSAPLLDQGAIYGTITLHLTVERGEEWDWFVIAYKRSEEIKHLKHSTIKQFSRTKAPPPPQILRLTNGIHSNSAVDTTDNRNIVFPLAVSISFVSLFDLSAAHLLRKNRPYVVLSCGSVNYTADPIEAPLPSSSGAKNRYVYMSCC